MHMGKRKRKRSMPAMILWDRRQQARFIEAGKRLVSLVGDLEILLAAKKRRSRAASKANKTRRSEANGGLHAAPAATEK
jgi:hypothetical protein